VSCRREYTPRYGPAVVKALTKIWEILDCICGKRLVGALPEVVPRLVAFKEIGYEGCTTATPPPQRGPTDRIGLL